MVPPKYRALGALVKRKSDITHDNEIASRAFDYYDDIQYFDPRLAPHQSELSPYCEALGYDLNNIACYISQILYWMDPQQLRNDARSLVMASAMTEATLVSVRCGGDAIAGMLGYIAAKKPGQAPRKSLYDLVEWASKNQKRLRDEAAWLTDHDFEWFKRARTIRDHLVHNNGYAVIGTDRKQFFLFINSSPNVWLAREPLLPLLKDLIVGLIRLSETVGVSLGQVLNVPADRINSRVLHGIIIPSLNKLLRSADLYKKQLHRETPENGYK